MLLSPAGENEDAKRAGFVSIQNSSTTFCYNYTPLPVRTGAERVIGGRNSPTFSATAKDAGTVSKVTKHAISVEYKDGTKASFPLGRQFGNNNAKDVPHELVTEFKAGDKFKAGNYITYNKYYFDPDPLNKGQAIFKMGMLARVAFIEGSDGYEDSCALSNKFTANMDTAITHIRDIHLDRTQGISNLVEVGTGIEVDTILCTIHNDQSDSNIFDEEAFVQRY